MIFKNDFLLFNIMDKLPSDIIDKILFEDYILIKYKLDNNSINDKFNLYFNMGNTKIINTQLKYLVNEYNYQTYVNTSSDWYKFKVPIHNYILYKCNSKNNLI